MHLQRHAHNECTGKKETDYGLMIIIKAILSLFFCQHGESHEELLSEIEAIERSGAKEFCVESRVYEDFCGKIKYECTLKLEKLPEIIEVGNAGEFVRMWVNGEKCTDAVNYPYPISVKGKCYPGENKIKAEK